MSKEEHIHVKDIEDNLTVLEEAYPSKSAERRDRRRSALYAVPVEHICPICGLLHHYDGTFSPDDVGHF